MPETIAELIKIWEEFVERQEAGGEESFTLNPDNGRVKKLAEGVLYNEQKHGLKYCPCQVTLGDKEEDLKLICPCNFKVQKTWKEKGECWCALFVKKK